MKAVLAVDTLKNLAPLLNLNPEFVEKGTGNPFRQRDKKKIIKMFIPEEPGGKVDDGLIKVIAESNTRATFFLLKPVGLSEQDAKMFRGAERSDIVFALLIKDEDENVFLLRRKEKNKILSAVELETLLKNIALGDKRYFDIRTVEIGEYLFDSIKKWEAIATKKLNILFTSTEYVEDRMFLLEAVDRIWGRPTMAGDRKSYEYIRKAIGGMRPEKIKRLLAPMIPEFAEIIKRYFAHGKR